MFVYCENNAITTRHRAVMVLDDDCCASALPSDVRRE